MRDEAERKRGKEERRKAKADAAAAAAPAKPAAVPATPIAFLFPGQGSQSVGMLDAWGDHPAVRATLAEVLAGLAAGDELLLHPPDAVKDGTPVTKPKAE